MSERVSERVSAAPVQKTSEHTETENVMVTTEVAPETPVSAEPAKPGTKRNWKAWRARVIVVLMIAAAVAGGSKLVQERSVVLDRYNLGTVTLTAQAIPVESNQSGQVSAVLVHPQQSVVQGQQLGTMIVTTSYGNGKQRRSSVKLTAPANGIVSSDPTPVGGIVQPGQPFVQMYDPTQLTLDAVVRVEDLSQLSPGMVATLRTEGLDREVRAQVTRVVPTVTGSASNGQLPAGQNKLQVVLTPEHISDVSRLIPGLHFTGTVDTGSGTSDDGLHVTG
jgi:multidrug resistance efflux pump